MNLMLTGGIATAGFIAATFFLRFWKRTGDRFFLFFAASFLVQGFNRVLLGFSSHPEEAEPRVYIIRFLSYCFILIAIADKNLARRRTEKSKPDKQAGALQAP